VITVVAAIFVPVVLLYQGWTYHVFRARLGGEPPAGQPVQSPPPTAARSPTG
jgi:cytochrome d ubiquinol oxidase subunit II